jgi:hypothetical protein
MNMRIRLAGSEMKVPDVRSIVVLLATLIPATGFAQQLSVGPPAAAESCAFARYIAWLNERDPFTESGPVALAIAASLPGLDKQASVVAIREVGESERTRYGLLEREGDAVVFERAIAPYLAAQNAEDNLPLSSVTITPRNYEFRYAGEVETEDHAAYIFRITPKENRAGLIQGELWIEPLTGAPVLVTGSLVKTPSASIRGVNIVREIKFVDGQPAARKTRMTIEKEPVGRVDLTIIELPLSSSDEDATPPTITGRNLRSSGLVLTGR